jgi:hypothetical protein
MRAEYGDAVSKALDDAPQAVRKAFFKQLQFLEGDLRHPSLRAEKYDGTHGIWQARLAHQLIFSQGRLKCNVRWNSRSLRQSYDSNQRARRKLRIVSALCPPSPTPTSR